MDVVVERVAGLDVSKPDVKACVRLPSPAGGQRYREQTRTFSAMTGHLQRLADWVAECRVHLVAMSGHR
jgi:hypothetical protein